MRKKLGDYPTAGKSGKRTKEQNRDNWLRRQYGISHEQYMEMLHRQGGCCAICRIEVERSPLDVDHSHGENDPKGRVPCTADMVRGLLCRRCNLGVGFIENSDWVNKAMQYIYANDPTRKKGK